MFKQIQVWLITFI